jgi:hypothetical protein
MLQRIIRSIAPAWQKVKTFGKALVGGTIYYYGNRIFWGGETSRYLYKRYRTIFQRMGFVRQAILAYKHRIVAERPKILSVNKHVMTLLEHRFKHIGLWEQYGLIAQDLLEFGDSFTEIVYSNPNSKQGFRVIGLKRLEPDYMYIQRDPYGRPILYISVIDGIPVTIEPYRMLHIKMDSQPGDAFGVGLIEGGMDDLAALRILEDLNIQLVKHNIYPHRVYICPSDEIVAQVESKLAQQNRFGDLVVPEGVKVQQMTSGTGIDLRGFMLYYQQKFFLDVGVPMDMLIKGTGGNRSTAAEMSSAFNGNASAIQRGILEKLEWLGELILTLEGIPAAVRLIAPEIDKALQFARRKEYREMFLEGLMSRDFAQELLELKHPLNNITVPENFTVQLNQEKNWMEQFKLGLLTRPYAIKLLGHDVPENRPAQPQTPNFMMAPPAQGQPPKPGQGKSGGVPLGNLDEPDLLEPSEVGVVAPTDKNEKQDGEQPPEAPENAQAAASRNIRVGLKSINVDKLEGTRMSKDGYVQTVYIRKVNNNGEIEEAPYVPVDVSVARKRAHVQPDARWKQEAQKDCGMNGNPKKGELVKPEQAEQIDGNASGIRTNTVVKPDGGKPLSQLPEGSGLKPRQHRNKALPPGHERGNRPLGNADAPLKKHEEPYGQPKNDDLRARAAELKEELERISKALGETRGDSMGKSLKDDDMNENVDEMNEELPPQPEQDQVEGEEAEGEDEGEVEQLPPDVGAESPPQGNEQPMPQQGMPGGQPQMPVVPGYFNPNPNGKYHPKFADVFGDNDYSIKKPQRHVERIKEELIDAYGQKHRRVHERTREHHRPASAESDFIKRKKTSAQRRWMKKSPNQLKQSKSQEEYYLAYIDVCLQDESDVWINRIVNSAKSAMDSSQNRLVEGLRQIAKEESNKIGMRVESYLAAELLVADTKLRDVVKEGLKNIHVAGLNFAKDVFAAHFIENNDDIRRIDANLKLLQERFLTRVAAKIAEKVDSSETVDTLVSEVYTVFSNARIAIETLVSSSGHELFRSAFDNIMRNAVVAEDITAIEFLVPKGIKACKNCEANSSKVMALNWFKFEPCHECATVYRIHFADEE